MQYVLTEKEYQALTDADEKAEEKRDEVLQDLCTKVADHMPAGVQWIGKEKPWGCILTAKREWYCDDCPVKEVCPNESKHWRRGSPRNAVIAKFYDDTPM